jgi:hypothetical protein
MDNKLSTHLEDGDYFLGNRLKEIQEILEYLQKEKVSPAEQKALAKRGLSWLSPCLKWAEGLHHIVRE